MLAVERLQYILDALQTNKVVLVTELSKEINVSEETIRRDLDKLEKQNAICRVHGGAFLKEDSTKQVIDKKDRATDLTMDHLARYCIQYIHEYDSIFLDSSNISYLIAKLLMQLERKLTIITNCLSIANELAESNYIKLVLLGGEYNRTNQAFFGQNTIDELNHYFVDKAFISSAGISVDGGITDFTIQEAIVHKSLLEQSKYRVYITDGKNIDKSAIHVADTIDCIDCFIAPNSVKQSALYIKLKALKVDIAICEGGDI